MKRLMIHIILLSMVMATGACQMIEVPVSIFYAVKGVDAGVPSMPYYAYSKAGLTKLNSEMVDAGTPVTLADTYKIVYGKDFIDVDPDGRSLMIDTDMAQATRSFQKILKAKKVPNPEHYILTIIDTARDQGVILFAAVYRPRLQIRVPAKYAPKTMQTLNSDDPEFYLPYQFDSHGHLDEVYEWAALPIKAYMRQSHQAVLFTLTANKVLEKKEKPNYWTEESKWIAGDYMAVAREQDEIYCEFLGIDQGFSRDLRF